MTVSVNRHHVCAAAAPKAQSIWSRLHDLIMIARQRRHLAKLDDHLLRDIGLSRHEATTEAQKTLWDVPNHWHK